MEMQKLQEIISPLFNEHVLLEILRKSSGYEDVELKSVKISDKGANKGDSYLSSVVRFTVEGSGTSKKDRSSGAINTAVIVKYIPNNIGRQKTFRSADFFKNEVEFYNSMYKGMLEFQKSKNIKNEFVSIPKCFYALSDGVNDFIALEDLNEQEFTSFKRQGEMDYDTVKLIVKLFAKFHALSYAYRTQCPEQFKQSISNMMETYFAEKYRPWYERFHKDIITVCRDAIAKELPEFYLKKFENAVDDDLYAKFIKISANSEDPLAVVMQGDAWIPNFLVKYGERGQITDARIIDFQLARCSSLAGDISFFMYSSSNYSFYNAHWDNIYTEYYTAFKSYVSELGSDITNLTYDVLKKSIKENTLVGIAMAMECLPFQLMEDSDSPDLDTIQGDEAVPITDIWIIRPIKTKAGRQKIANMLKHAIDNGFM